MERVAACRSRSRGPPERWNGGGTRGGRLAHRQSLLDRCGRCDPVQAAWSCRPSARVLRSQSRGADPAAAGLDGRFAPDALARGLGRERGNSSRAAELCTERAIRARAPHRRHELLHRFAIRGDRPWDRDLPREGQRLERHRLQLSRRQVRPGLRGQVWRCRQAGHWRACGRVQHRFRRGCSARQLRLERTAEKSRGLRLQICSPGDSTSRTSIRHQA